MSRIIAVFNANKGEMHGFKDHRQAQEYLGFDKKKLDDLLWQGGGYHNGMFVSELIQHKSNRGGKRS
jgi:hypothetical protein